MIKRTLYFGNPAYLSLKLKQLVVRLPQKDGENKDEKELTRTVPIEDIGVVILDHKQITVTQGLISELLDNNCAVITCDSRQLPVGLMLPLAGNSVQNERFRLQIDASLPLKKQLWQQTIEAKIRNQAAMLHYSTGETHNNMLKWSESVRSGDTENMEARAAVYYWKTVFPDNPYFVRDHEGGGANALLNYGYAILRAIVARALVASGLLPTLGIHHHNRYNAYCLADDIMEPYRPYVDRVVFDMISDDLHAEVTVANKIKLLNIPVVEVMIGGRRSPLMVAVSHTTASLVKCFRGESRRLIYPEM
ncbi:MAG: type II CRISPR-associated endonuclease Cas1 [Bacteroidales bacterium]|nr:type II CRISPR-associated endonuclease Cas1 [Bacteroidales bacterium]MBQ9723291.1 type II CRISPR-associated endonuclease Cas1 [Bacteroidales bacterium]